MKYKFFKTATLSISAVLMLLISGCLKKAPGFTDFSQVSDFVILKGAGTGNFKASNIPSSPDTIALTVTADLASANSNNAAVKVTIGLDNAQIATYNAANGTNFQPFPATAFKIVSNTITIPGGLNHYGSTTIQVYHNQLDPAVSYMLPISITDASGKKLSSNQNTIFYNVIGNPIAGAYNWDFQRWNNATGTGPTAGGTFFGATTAFIPDNPTQVEVPSGYYIQPRYVITFTNTNGVLSNFKATFNPDDLAALVAAGVSVTSGPNIIKADPITKEYIIQYQVSIGTAFRYLIDRFYK